MRLTVEDDDLWGPPLVVEDDTFRKQTMRGCEFWFDCRTDVLEENFQNEKYCELAWRILSEKKQDVEIDEVDKDSVSIQNDMVSSGSGGDSHDVVGSSDSDKTLSADTSSAKSVLDEDENASSISDAQTVETRDSSNETEEIELETRLEPQETAANGGPLTVEVSEDADISSCPVLLTSKVEEAEEHSCSSLVTDQVLDPIKQVLENKSSSSAISRENTGGSTLRPLLLEIEEKVREEANAAISREDTGGSSLRPLLLKIREKVREKANAAATNKDVEIVKDHQQNDGLQDIVTVSEPFTTESLLDLCDEEPDKGREMACDERSEQTHIEAVKTVVKEELIITLLNEAREKAASKALLNPVTALIKKRKRDNNKGMSTNFIRNIKKKVKGEAGEIIIRGSSVPPQHADSLLDSVEGISRGSGRIVSDSVMSISTSELKNKTGKELRSLAKELKVTQYYKLKKEDLVQRLTNHINQLTECKKQRMESEPISLV